MRARPSPRSERSRRHYLEHRASRLNAGSVLVPMSIVRGTWDHLHRGAPMSARRTTRRHVAATAARERAGPRGGVTSFWLPGGAVCGDTAAPCSARLADVVPARRARPRSERRRPRGPPPPVTAASRAAIPVRVVGRCRGGPSTPNLIVYRPQAALPERGVVRSATIVSPAWSTMSRAPPIAIARGLMLRLSCGPRASTAAPAWCRFSPWSVSGCASATAAEREALRSLIGVGIPKGAYMIRFAYLHAEEHYGLVSVPRAR